MNKYLLLIFFIFSITLSAQNEDTSLQSVYLTELLNSIEDETFASFDTDDINWRKSIIKKATSKNNVIENSYAKTAMVLHMLKYKVGDHLFFRGIEKYKEYLKIEKAKLDLSDLQYYIENESGVQLTHFFNDWFRSNGYPSYKIKWFQNETSNDVSFSVKQTQNKVSNSFFEIPVPIEVKGINGESQFMRLELSQDGQNFVGNVPFTIESVVIDPEYHIISNKNIAEKGIDQEVLDATITLYPNPAKSMISIQNSSDAVVEKISIYNMLGKLVLQKNNPLAAIDLNNLSLGVHLVKIETSQGVLHKTILKE